MGSIAYDFLTESVLFNDSDLKSGFSSFNDKQLRKELDNYRNHCIKNMGNLTEDAKKSSSSLKVLSNVAEIPFSTLKQGALYFDQFIIYDPLFALTEVPSEQTKFTSKQLGFQEPGGINRKDLIRTLMLLKRVTPMIAQDYLKMLPLSYAFEAPESPRIHFPTNSYEDILPNELLELSKTRAIVRSMQQTKDNNGWIIMDSTDLTPGIFINFEGTDMSAGSIYNYMDVEVISTDDATRTVQLKQKLAEYPMDKNVWDMWVQQSINKTAKSYVDKLHYENVVALEMAATYLTDSKFSSELLGCQFGFDKSIENFSAETFINLDLPFLDEIDLGKLMMVRKYEEDVFANFRMELEREFRELRLVKDPKELELRKENILHELGNTQVKKIDAKLRSLKRKGKLDGALLLGGLAGAVQTSGFSLLASALAAVKGYKDYKDYKEQLVENPSYLLWKAKKD